jgi:hypothetical protein
MAYFREIRQGADMSGANVKVGKVLNQAVEALHNPAGFGKKAFRGTLWLTGI